MSTPLVAAIVPAFNEEATIGPVLKVLIASSILDEVIVVSDGSTDRTVEIAKDLGVTVVEHKVNQGKGATMLDGVRQAKSPIIVFFDADLRGLTTDHVFKLVTPVISGEKAMNVGIRDRGRLISSLGKYLPLISGERALLREIIEKVPEELLKGFMVESALNHYCRTRKLVFGTVILNGLSIRRKYEKVGMVKGVWGYIKMSIQIVWSMIAVRGAHLLGKF